MKIRAVFVLYPIQLLQQVSYFSNAKDMLNYALNRLIIFFYSIFIGC